MNFRKPGPRSAGAARPQHPTEEVWLDRLDGRLSQTAQAEVDAHLSGCAKCRREARAVERVLTAIRRDRAELPPQWARSRARDLFAPRPVPVRLPRRLPFSLIFDSWLAPAPARRAMTGSRRIMLRAVGLDVDLEIEPGSAADERLIQGQALPSGGQDWKEVRVRLSRTGRAGIHALPTARLGFRFEPLPPGSYRLTLEAGGRQYVFPELAIE